ncbi:MAG: hypothetical protein KJ630_18455 [Proteobacteria bacterium]|nr:hypothetical protein [Pseudomonadota bacterium]
MHKKGIMEHRGWLMVYHQGGKQQIIFLLMVIKTLQAWLIDLLLQSASSMLNDSGMTTIFLTLIFYFVLLLAAIFTLSYCKRRQSATKHGLTGMCHKTGGAMCSSCSDKLVDFQTKR